MRCALATAALVALLACPAALAHGGGGAGKGYTSRVTGIRPAVSGVTVTVRDGDDRLRLVNASGEPLVVRGYDDEPYLRFADGAVYRNTHSPATYLNDDRYARVSLPADADAEAPPAWERVASGNVYEWHDHRIHWMDPNAPPPVVRDDPDHSHTVFDWQVPISVDGRDATVAGVLSYEPPSGGLTRLLLLAPLLALPVLVYLLARTGALSRRTRP